MTADWRALCVELVAWADKTSAHYYVPPEVLVRARAALSEPEGPTVMEIIELADEIESAELGQVDLVRAALDRWGHQPAAPAEGEQRHPTPVPVSERLPGAEDCDAEGRCWWFCFECPGEYSYWILAKEVYRDPTYWLPAHALPLPSLMEQPKP